MWKYWRICFANGSGFEVASAIFLPLSLISFNSCSYPFCNSIANSRSWSRLFPQYSHTMPPYTPQDSCWHADHPVPHHPASPLKELYPKKNLVLWLIIVALQRELRIVHTIANIDNKKWGKYVMQYAFLWANNKVILLFYEGIIFILNSFIKLALDQKIHMQKTTLSFKKGVIFMPSELYFRYPSWKNRSSHHHCRHWLVAIRNKSRRIQCKSILLMSKIIGNS